MEIEKEINRRIQEYRTGDDYSPLKVELGVTPPIYFTSPYIHLDGILNYLCTRDALGELFYCMPSNKTIYTHDLDLPVARTEDVYHTSIGIYGECNKVQVDTIYKRFTDKETYHLSRRHQKGRVKTNQGHFKDFMINLPTLITNKIIFYCKGDKKELKRLLGHLTHIGKKTSIGSGRIHHVHLTETEYDYSFFKDNELMRVIPARMKVPLIEGTVFQREAYKPPYWDKNNVTMCRVPSSQVKI